MANEHPENVDDRELINVSDGDLKSVADRLLGLVLKKNNPAKIFRHRSNLVRLELNEQGRLFLRVLDNNRMTSELLKMFRFVVSRGYSWVDVHPPARLVSELLARSDLSVFPAVEGIAEFPFFASDGALQRIEGYSALTGWYLSLKTFGALSISSSPSRSEIREARGLIDEFLAKFTFVDVRDRTHALAATIQLFVREMIPGQTPLYVVITPGSHQPARPFVITSHTRLLEDVPRPLPYQHEDRTGNRVWARCSWIHQRLFSLIMQAH